MFLRNKNEVLFMSKNFTLQKVVRCAFMRWTHVSCMMVMQLIYSHYEKSYTL